MNKKLKNTIQYIIFLSIGVFLFYFVYKDIELGELENELSKIEYSWVFLALGIGILSHISRAIRWRMLIKPLNYEPGIVNTLIAVLIMYFTNIIIPRGGEIARCTVMHKYEKIPVAKLLGTVVTERIIDVIVLFMMIILVIIIQLSKIDEFLISHPEVADKLASLTSVNVILKVLFIIILGITLIFFIRKRITRTKIWHKIREYVVSFKEGIISIKKVEKKGLLIFHSLFIYLMYYLMFYVVFKSYGPTINVSVTAGLSAFIAGGLAMIAPVQAGIGAWHFMVYETLFLFGIDKYDGKIFALISHTSTNLFILFSGVIALVLLPVINTHIKKQNLNSEDPA